MWAASWGPPHAQGQLLGLASRAQLTTRVSRGGCLIPGPSQAQARCPKCLPHARPRPPSLPLTFPGPSSNGLLCLAETVMPVRPATSLPLGSRGRRPQPHSLTPAGAGFPCHQAQAASRGWSHWAGTHTAGLGTRSWLGLSARVRGHLASGEGCMGFLGRRDGVPGQRPPQGWWSLWPQGRCSSVHNVTL